MNACGRDLTCADMVGNFILMPLDRNRQERLYTDHLYPIECGFERHGGEDHFEAFIRHYLTLRTGEVPKQGEEYAVFRTHARSRRVQEAGPETLAGDLRTCADHYRAIVLGEEPDPELAQTFREVARLEMKPVYPFLLHLYGDYAGERLSRHDLVTLTRLVTAYAVRRAVCGYKPAAPPPVFARAPAAITLDIDDTCDPVHGHQQLSLFNAHYDRGRDAGCPAPPAQIRTCPLRHPAPPLGCAMAGADGKSLIRPRVSNFQFGPVRLCYPRPPSGPR